MSDTLSSDIGIKKSEKISSEVKPEEFVETVGIYIKNILNFKRMIEYSRKNYIDIDLSTLYKWLTQLKILGFTAEDFKISIELHKSGLLTIISRCKKPLYIPKYITNITLRIGTIEIKEPITVQDLNSMYNYNTEKRFYNILYYISLERLIFSNTDYKTLASLCVIQLWIIKDKVVEGTTPVKNISEYLNRIDTFFKFYTNQLIKSNKHQNNIEAVKKLEKLQEDILYHMIGIFGNVAQINYKTSTLERPIEDMRTNIQTIEKYIDELSKYS